MTHGLETMKRLNENAVREHADSMMDRLLKVWSNAKTAAPEKAVTAATTPDTIVIQVGNTDNQLKQGEWALFCEDIRDMLNELAHQVHFEGGSSFDSPWQNACWVCEANPEQVSLIRHELTRSRLHFRQKSVAITIGNTVFI